LNPSLFPPSQTSRAEWLPSVEIVCFMDGFSLAYIYIH
jgi:hypothetical protein